VLFRKKLRAEHNIDVKYVQLDVTDDDSILRAKEAIEKTEGKLDVLVNNAGTYQSIVNGSSS
jgi:NAD(P)-dependent dehydrogenase (short-subunit alcohol dehydrogenase family)